MNDLCFLLLLLLSGGKTRISCSSRRLAQKAEGPNAEESNAPSGQLPRNGAHYSAIKVIDTFSISQLFCFDRDLHLCNAVK